MSWLAPITRTARRAGPSPSKLTLACTESHRTAVRMHDAMLEEMTAPVGRRGSHDGELLLEVGHVVRVHARDQLRQRNRSPVEAPVRAVGASRSNKLVERSYRHVPMSPASRASAVARRSATAPRCGPIHDLLCPLQLRNVAHRVYQLHQAARIIQDGRSGCRQPTVQRRFEQFRLFLAQRLS